MLLHHGLILYSLLPVDDRIERAIRIVASDPGLYESKESRDSHVTLSADSVEDTVTSGLDLASLTPHQLIRLALPLLILVRTRLEIVFAIKCCFPSIT